MSVLNEYMNNTQRDILQHTGIHRRTIDDVIERIEDRRMKEQKSERVRPTVIPQAPVVSQEIAKKQSGIHELAQQVKADEGKDIDFSDLLSGLSRDNEDDDTSSATEENGESVEDIDLADIQRMIDGNLSDSSSRALGAGELDKKSSSVSTDELDDFADIQRMIDEASASTASHNPSTDFNELLKGLKKKK